MTPEEKIEALRQWVRQNDQPDFGTFAAGHLKAVTEVRDIIDPPKPEWSRLVEQEEPYWVNNGISPDAALRRVLIDLGEIADASWQTKVMCLARIVAICEGQVGDGWQADPEAFEWAAEWHTAWGLLVALANDGGYQPSESDWRHTGRMAVHWLRSLTDGGAA